MFLNRQQILEAPDVIGFSYFRSAVSIKTILHKFLRGKVTNVQIYHFYLKFLLWLFYKFISI
jgi:hypothetical protein